MKEENMNLDKLDLTEVIIDKEHKEKIYYFIYQQKKYFFKKGDLDYCYKSLIGSEIAKCLGLPTLEFSFAAYNGDYGVVSPTYNPENKKEVNLSVILEKYYDEVISKNKEGFSNEQFLESTLNLETTWWAIEYYYKDKKNVKEITAHLMQQIVDYYILQIIIGEIDLHSKNICILDSEEPTLAKYYDYDASFEISFSSRIPYGYAMNPYPNPESRETTPVQSIRTFLSASDSSYADYLNEIINKAPDIEFIFERVEEKTGFPMPEEYKEEYRYLYHHYLTNINTILEDYFHNLKK